MNTKHFKHKMSESQSQESGQRHSWAGRSGAGLVSSQNPRKTCTALLLLLWSHTHCWEDRTGNVLNNVKNRIGSDIYTFTMKLSVVVESK